MNLAEASIRNKTTTLVFAVLMVVLGIWSYINLPRLEDPEFTVKDALIITSYPGASPKEVADEVTDVIERAVQQLGQLERVESRSERGLSTVTASIKDSYDRNTLPQVWDELRRKIADVQGQLPPGTGPSLVLKSLPASKRQSMWKSTAIDWPSLAFGPRKFLRFFASKILSSLPDLSMWGH
jgi:multidrug efflux pump subunit AcrB